VFLFSFCDSAESDFCGAAAPLPNEPNPPDGFDACAGASDDVERRLNDPKPPDFDDDVDDDDDRCDENPPLNDDDVDGFASAASTCASGTSRDSMNAT
jgi:hypothetical protein